MEVNRRRDLIVFFRWGISTSGLVQVRRKAMWARAGILYGETDLLFRD